MSINLIFKFCGLAYLNCHKYHKRQQYCGLAELSLRNINFYSRHTVVGFWRQPMSTHKHSYCKKKKLSFVVAGVLHNEILIPLKNTWPFNLFDNCKIIRQNLNTSHRFSDQYVSIFFLSSCQCPNVGFLFLHLL